MGFSESGRLQVDVKLASFATRARGRVQQVSPLQPLLACQVGVVLASLPLGAMRLLAWQRVRNRGGRCTGLPQSHECAVGALLFASAASGLQCTWFRTLTIRLHLQTTQEREYSALACAALEKAVLLESFPKAIVDVYACVLEAGELHAADPNLRIRDAMHGSRARFTQYHSSQIFSTLHLPQLTSVLPQVATSWLR